MDVKCVGDFQCLCCDVDVFFYIMCQGVNVVVFNGVGDGLDGFKIIWRRDWEVYFYDINIYVFKGQGNLQFFFCVQVGL